MNNTPIKSIGCIKSSIRLFSTSSARLGRNPENNPNFQETFQKFLGPKDIRGEYPQNPYYYPPTDNNPKYIGTEGMQITRDVSSSFRNRPAPYINRGRNQSLHPFPNNTNTTTAYMLPDELKDKILEEVTENGLTAQQVAIKYQINILRIEAILKLNEIREKFIPDDVCI